MLCRRHLYDSVKAKILLGQIATHGRPENPIILPTDTGQSHSAFQAMESCRLVAHASKSVAVMLATVGNWMEERSVQTETEIIVPSTGDEFSGSFSH
jgi:hypothetical protein